MSNTILVIGATGAMGRAVVQALLRETASRAWKVRVFTRDPASRRAQALKAENPDRIELYQGNLEDSEALGRAMSGMDGAFINTDFFSIMSVRGEFEQGVRALQAAEAAGVQHVVYSTLEATTLISDGQIPVPHFDAKAAVQHWVAMMRSDEFMRKVPGFYTNNVTMLMTAPYFENFQSVFPPEPDGEGGYIFRFAAADKPHPMIALADIGWFAEHIFANPDRWKGRSLEILGDDPTLADVVQTFTNVTGLPARYEDMPLEVVRQFPGFGHDLANMYAFIQTHGIKSDLAALRAIHPRLLTFKDWLAASGWRGERREVQALLAQP